MTRTATTAVTAAATSGGYGRSGDYGRSSGDYGRESDYGRGRDYGMQSRQDDDWGRYGSGYSGRYGGDYSGRGQSFGGGSGTGYGGDYGRDRGYGGSSGGNYGRDYGRDRDWGRDQGMGDEDRSRSGWGRGGVQTDFGDEASGRSYVGNEGRGYGYGPDYRRDQWDYGREGDRGRERSDYGRQGGYGREGGYSSRGYDRGGYGDRDRGERGWWDRTRDEVASWFGDDDAERRRQQDFRGRGPKGYRRSDERIKEDISDRLADDWQVDASEIDVGVSNAGGDAERHGRQPRRAAAGRGHRRAGLGREPRPEQHPRPSAGVIVEQLAAGHVERLAAGRPAADRRVGLQRAGHGRCGRLDHHWGHRQQRHDGRRGHFGGRQRLRRVPHDRQHLTS